MAFFAMVFASVFILLLIILAFLMLIFFVLATVFKIVGRKKGSRKLKIAGNVFLVLGILFAAPIIALIIYFAFNAAYEDVTLPDGETKYVLAQHVSEMDSYVENPDEGSLEKLEKLLDKDSALVFYQDVNRYSIIDNGIKMGNADIVKIALAHGAIFDNPKRYDHMAYVSSSMDDYLCWCDARSITEDDIEILELMFENHASTEIKTNGMLYSNVFGMAVWTVLYNIDDAVTDTELEFIQIFIDNGLSTDEDLRLANEKIPGYDFSDNYHDRIVKDGNYDRLMDIIGK